MCRPKHGPRGQAGTSSVEVVVLLAGVVIPLLHLLAGVATVQAAVQAAESAAQRAVRSAVAGDLRTWKEQAVSSALSELEGRTALISPADEDGDGVLSRGELVTVTVSESIPLAPPLPWSVTVSSTGVGRVDPCRSLDWEPPRVGEPGGDEAARAVCGQAK
ncbi:MAG: hypothetical protein DYH08_02890 [Actinobacteria bacterium ATB1]|nr:hypothetical protein [Actinobacteria bacterium ATB1]